MSMPEKILLSSAHVREIQTRMAYWAGEDWTMYIKADIVDQTWNEAIEAANDAVFRCHSAGQGFGQMSLAICALKREASSK